MVAELRRGSWDKTRAAMTAMVEERAQCTGLVPCKQQVLSGNRYGINARRVPGIVAGADAHPSAVKQGVQLLLEDRLRREILPA
jgi:hypothetical protein